MAGLVCLDFEELASCHKIEVSEAVNGLEDAVADVNATPNLEVFKLHSSLFQYLDTARAREAKATISFLVDP